MLLSSRNPNHGVYFHLLHRTHDIYSNTYVHMIPGTYNTWYTSITHQVTLYFLAPVEVLWVPGSLQQFCTIALVASWPSINDKRRTMTGERRTTNARKGQRSRWTPGKILARRHVGNTIHACYIVYTRYTTSTHRRCWKITKPKVVDNTAVTIIAVSIFNEEPRSREREQLAVLCRRCGRRVPPSNTVQVAIVPLLRH